MSGARVVFAITTVALLLLTGAAGVLATVGFAQPAPSVAGVWNGAIETPGVRLSIVVRLEAGDSGAWSGTIDIPQQGAKALPLADVMVKLPDVSFRIANIPGDPTIRLTLSADATQMSGTLTQGLRYKLAKLREAGVEV